MSRNKQYNPRKGAELELRRRLKDRLFIYCEGVNDKMFGTNRKGDMYSIDALTMNAAADTPQKWVAHLIAGCHNSKGKQDIKELIVGGDGYYYHNQLLDSIREKQDAQLNDLKSKNVKIAFVAFIVYAVGEELTPEQVEAVLNKIGAWNERD